MTLFSAAKETTNTLRWDTLVDGVNFAFYIPKWRIPSPAPSKIWVVIVPRRAECEDLSNLTPSAVAADSSLTNEPIIATCHRYEEKVNTVRFLPVGPPGDCEIGEPYIPHSLIEDVDKRLRIIVMWDLTSRGLFLNTPLVAR